MISISIHLITFEPISIWCEHNWNNRGTCEKKKLIYSIFIFPPFLCLVQYLEQFHLPLNASCAMVFCNIFMYISSLEINERLFMNIANNRFRTTAYSLILTPVVCLLVFWLFVAQLLGPLTLRINEQTEHYNFSKYRDLPN